MNELYDAALVAESEHRLTEWFVDYLKDSGRNLALSGGLAEDGQFHTPLINFPIEKLKILMGPSYDFRYYEDPEKYNDRVEAMVVSIRQGWKPVPFIASKDLWNEGLELNDGAHRAEALKRTGVTAYPTVIYFKDQQSLEDFNKTLN